MSGREEERSDVIDILHGLEEKKNRTVSDGEETKLSGQICLFQGVN